MLLIVLGPFVVARSSQYFKEMIFTLHVFDILNVNNVSTINSESL